jgi:hypothetical protein
MPTPRTGACDPWVSGPTLEELPAVKVRKEALLAKEEITPERMEALCALCATVASDELYEKSGKIFPGQCGPVTVRPVSRPTDVDTRAWSATLSTVGWVASQGFASAYGSFNPAVVARYGSLEPPSIELPYPVTEIAQVKIDGIVIPASEYELRDFKTLVRIRPSRSSVPTARWGWPTSQVMDLPDTEPGTFSVTYMYGNPPPAAGILAAEKLAEVVLLPKLGDTTQYPKRIVNINRQGVSAMVTDVLDIVMKGGTGIYEVELFLSTYNPSKLKRQAAVWSPDMGRPGRRTERPST